MCPEGASASVSWLVVTVARTRNESRCSRARRALPVSIPAHGVAGPSCRSRPPSGSSPPRPTGASCMTTGGCRATIVNEAHGAMDFGTSCVRTGRRRCLKLAGRTHHIAMSAATMTGAVPMAHGCTVASTVQRASSHSTRMLSSKVTGRAGRRRGYERRGHDGRAQSCAAWAMPRPVERAPASDGADDREERTSAFRSRPCL